MRATAGFRFKNHPALRKAQLYRCRDHCGSTRHRVGPFPLGSSLHHIGDLGGARVELEAALQRGSNY
jgi:hypothetical protein